MYINSIFFQEFPLVTPESATYMKHALSWKGHCRKQPKNLVHLESLEVYLSLFGQLPCVVARLPSCEAAALPALPWMASAARGRPHRVSSGFVSFPSFSSHPPPNCFFFPRLHLLLSVPLSHAFFSCCFLASSHSLASHD